MDEFNIVIIFRDGTSLVQVIPAMDSSEAMIVGLIRARRTDRTKEVAHVKAGERRAR